MRCVQLRHLIMALAAMLVLATPAWSCPNCKEAISAQPADVANAARGYNWSIMLMLGVPATMLGTGAFMVRRAVKLGMMPEL